MSLTTLLLHVAIILVCVRLDLVHAVQCTNEAVGECLKPLQEVDYDVNAVVVPVLDEATLRDHCGRYDKFEFCMRSIKSTCSRLDQVVYEGIEDAYEFLCRDGFKEYLEHRACFTNQVIHTEGSVCNVTMYESFARAQRSGSSAARIRDLQCLYLEQYLDCVENVITRLCNEKAARWQRTLDAKSLTPLFKAMGCPLDGLASNWVTITVACVLAFSVIIIIIAIILLIMRNRKRRQANAERQANAQRHELQQGAPAPPPYDGSSAFVVGYTAQYGVNMPTANGHTDVDRHKVVQPPPYSESYITPDLNVPAGDGVAAGYFGASGSTVANPYGEKSASQNELVAGAGPLPTKDGVPVYVVSSNDETAFAVYEGISHDNAGIANPAFNNVDQGYFGAHSHPSKK